jgi:hypothetical protein
MKIDLLPTWARIVHATKDQTSAAVLKEQGFTLGQIMDAVDGGHVKTTGKGVKLLVSSTFKGRRSLSIVSSEQIIAHYRAVPSVAAPPIGPPKERYDPPDMTPARTDAQDFLLIPSKGM